MTATKINSRIAFLVLGIVLIILLVVIVVFNNGNGLLGSAADRPSGASIAITKTCAGSNVEFTLVNVGIAMVSDANYAITDPNGTTRSFPFRLGQRERKVITLGSGTYGISVSGIASSPGSDIQTCS